MYTVRKEQNKKKNENRCRSEKKWKADSSQEIMSFTDE